MRKKIFKIMLFLLFLLINQICLASEIEVLYGIGVPVNVEFKVSPYKRVYSPGEEVNVDVRIYFDRELIGEEIGREYLVIGNFTSGCETRGLKKKRTAEAPWATLEISESSFKDNYIYLRNQSDEVHGNFKIKITDEIARIELYAMSYMLGVRDILGEYRSSQMTVNGETVSYIRTRRCEYQNIPETKLQQYNKSGRGSRDIEIAEPHDYETCELKFGTNPDIRNPFKYLTNTDTEIRFQDISEILYVYCEDETVGEVNWNISLGEWVFEPVGNAGDESIIRYVTTETDYLIPFELVDSYQFKGHIEFHETDISGNHIFNNSLGKAYLYNANDLQNSVAEVDIDVNGNFNFQNIDYLEVVVQFNLRGPYYDIIEENEDSYSDAYIKNTSVGFYNPCGFPELWTHNGLINYIYQQFPVQEPNNFYPDPDIGLIYKKQNYDFCSGVHVLQQVKRFDDFNSIGNRSYFVIFVDNTIEQYQQPFMDGYSSYLVSSSIDNPYGFDLVYINSNEHGNNNNPDQWDNQIIFHELTHAYHFDISGIPFVGGDHGFSLPCSQELAYVEGLAHFVSAVVKSRTTSDEWDFPIFSSGQYTQPERLTYWRYDTNGYIVGEKFDTGIVIDLETLNVPLPPNLILGNGNRIEATIAMFLWDVYDDQIEPCDVITHDFFELWWSTLPIMGTNITTINQWCDKFTEFFVEPEEMPSFINLANSHYILFHGNAPREIYNYPDDFAGLSLQQAIDSEDIEDYDIIVLDEDNYTVDLQIDRPIYLVSNYYLNSNENSIDNTIINGSISISGNAMAGKIIGLSIYNANDNAVILNNTIYGIENCNISDSEYGIYSNYSSVSISDCKITGCNNAYSMNNNPIIPDNTSISIYRTEFSGNNMVNINDNSVSYFENCTIAGNNITGLGINETELQNTIIWGNTINLSGSLLSMNYCNIEGGYDGIGNIDLEPNFAHPTLGDYHLTSESFCIDSGNPSFPLDPDYSIVDIGCYYFEHINSDYFIIEHNWNWVSYPRLSQQGFHSNEIFEQAYYENGLPGLLQSTSGGEPTINGFIRIDGKNKNITYNGTFGFLPYDFENMLFRHEGYKIQINYEVDEQLFVVDGDRLASYSLDMTAMEYYWLGYYITYPQNIEDAFGEDYWSDVNKVWAEDWFYDKMNNNREAGDPELPANSTTGKTLEYGKMYIVQMYRDADDFSWNGSITVEIPSENSEAEYFTYIEEAEYEAIDIVDIPENITEIGVFEDDVCVGAIVVTNSSEQVLAYTTSSNRDQIPLTFELVVGNRGLTSSVKDYKVLNQLTGQFEQNVIIAGRQDYSAITLGEYNENPTPGISKVQLHNNYPNPFNPVTNISFSIPTEQEVKLKIYNLKGQKVRELVNGQIVSGTHSVVWNGTDDNGKQVGSGLYFYKLKTGHKEISKKMMLLK